MTYNAINPSHYHGDRRFEPIEVIEDWQLNYRLGNALKYIARNGRKPGEDPCEGLRKAVWYLTREIEALEGAKTPYAVTYQDVLEDYAACAAEGAEPHESLDEAYDVWEALERQESLWDPSLGPVEPEEELTGEFCEVDLHELHKDLDQFETDEIISTFERRGLIFGVDKLGRTYVLGTQEV